MKNSWTGNHIAHVLIIGLCVALLLMVFSSWVMATVGLDVQSLLTAEAIRWIFVQHDKDNVVARGHYILMLVLLVGGILKACRRTNNVHIRNSRKKAFVCALIVFLLFFSLLCLLIIPDNAPLKSVVGLIWPSPFILVELRALLVSLLVALVVYGSTRGNLNGADDYIAVFYYGIQRFAPWILVWFLIEIFINLLRYVFG